jgi:hypothetical protein
MFRKPKYSLVNTPTNKAHIALYAFCLFNITILSGQRITLEWLNKKQNAHLAARWKSYDWTLVSFERGDRIVNFQEIVNYQYNCRNKCPSNVFHLSMEDTSYSC